MFDATDLEIARRELSAEMGGESRSDRAWSRFYDAAEREIIARGWDDKFTGKDSGLDGADDENGYSIDSAYEAFEKGHTVAAYIEAVAATRNHIGL